MKIIFILGLTLTLNILSAQPKGSNTIMVKGVEFKEAANKLLDHGYSIDRIDSNFQTIKTEWKQGVGENKWMKLRLFARVKDSTIIITGDWYNTMFVGSKIMGVDHTIENTFRQIKNSWGAEKNCFVEMNAFAISFNKPVEYLK